MASPRRAESPDDFLTKPLKRSHGTEAPLASAARPVKRSHGTEAPLASAARPVKRAHGTPRAARVGREAGLLDVELVTLGIEHGDPVFARFLKDPDPPGAQAGESLRLCLDAGLTLIERNAGPSADIQVGVDPVLYHLAFGHALEVNARALALRIDDRAGRIPLAARHALR